jgi:UDP-GlcNAc:undecaprenyl-phosphate/decaprenyl-phosphate GlcNAc-1-phosphate transferase
MTVISAITIGLGGFLVSFTLLRVILYYFAHTRGPGVPREFHHTHKETVPRFGGLALIAAFIAVFAIVFLFFSTTPERQALRWIVAASALAMFLVGFWDDLRAIGAKRKLLLQILVATTVVYAGIGVQQIKLPFTETLIELPSWLSALLTIGWLVGMTNLINLIDGMDGLAAGIALMLMFLIAFLGFGADMVFPVVIAIGMCGALAAFLWHNFPPARIYMGDGGAYFLGFLIGIMSLVTSQKGTIVAALIAPLFALALPILDVSLAIVRRGLKGLPIFRPDKHHLHHRLLNAGISRRRAVLILYAISLVCLSMAFGVFFSQGRLIPLLVGVLFLVFMLAAKSFDFSREWFSIGKTLGNSLELRKDTRYALVLSDWLQMEALRSESVQNLWEDFKFVARKLGFSRVKLILADGEKSWQRDIDLPSCLEHYLSKHDFSAKSLMILELSAHPYVMHRQRFELLNDLAAEAWLKAISTWENRHGQPLCFDSSASPEFIEKLAPRPKDLNPGRANLPVAAGYQPGV